MNSFDVNIKGLGSYPTQDLVCYLPLAGDLNDASGNGWNFAAQASAVWSYNTDRHSTFGKSLYFGATNSTGGLNRASQYGLIANRSALTVCLWFRDMAATAGVSKQLLTETYYALGNGLSINASGQVDCTCKINGVVKQLTSTTNYRDSLWHFLVLKYDGSTLGLYVDTVAVATPASATGTINYDNRDRPTIGASSTASLWYTGALAKNLYIDDIFVYNRGLTDGEINTIYNL